MRPDSAVITRTARCDPDHTGGLGRTVGYSRAYASPLAIEPPHPARRINRAIRRRLQRRPCARSLAALMDQADPLRELLIILRADAWLFRKALYLERTRTSTRSAGWARCWSAWSEMEWRQRTASRYPARKI